MELLIVYSYLYIKGRCGHIKIFHQYHSNLYKGSEITLKKKRISKEIKFTKDYALCILGVQVRFKTNAKLEHSSPYRTSMRSSKCFKHLCVFVLYH